jgi:hypothetical protein
MITLVLVKTDIDFQETALLNKLFSVVVLIAAICQPGTSRAGELLFPEKNFAITPPEAPGWQRPPKQPSGIILSLSTIDMGSSFTIEAIEFDAQILNASSIKDINAHFDLSISGTEKTKKDKKEARQLTIHGMPAYEISGLVEIDGEKRNLVVQYILANKQLYVLSALTNRKSLSRDLQLEKILNSFRFINRPPAPSVFVDKGLLLIGAGSALVCMLAVIVMTIRIAKQKKNELQPL